MKYTSTEGLQDQIWVGRKREFTVCLKCNQLGKWNMQKYRMLSRKVNA